MIDPGKLSAWFESHAARLVLYARQLAGERAADVVQEAFVRLMQAPREPDNVKAWLYRAVRNGAVSVSRTERARVKRHERLGQLRPAWFETPTDEGDPLDAAEAQACLASLPAPLREVVVLRIWG